MRCGVGDYLYQFSGLPFYFVNCVLCLTEASQFQDVPFINSPSQCLCYGVMYRKQSPVPINSRALPTFSYKRFSVAGFMLRSLIHLNLKFCAW